MFDSMLPYVDGVLTWSYNTLTFFFGSYLLLVDGMTLERFIAVNKPLLSNNTNIMFDTLMF